MSRSNKLLILYYMGMLLLMISWTDTEVAPNIIIRCAFLVGIIIPALKIDKSFLAPIVISFMAISQNGFAHGYMPENLLFYTVILLVCLFLFYPVKNHFQISSSLWILFIYVTIVDIIIGFNIERVSYSFFVSVLLLAFTSSNSKKDINLWSFCFVLVSLVLSGLYLLNQDRFSESYYNAGIERIGWMDPNYFGMVIGMGCVIALQSVLSKNEEGGIYYRIFFRSVYFVTIIISLLTLVLNASRGALLATGMAAMLTMFFTKGKTLYRLLSILFILLGLIFIYQNSYLELLMYRMENDDIESGNGRYVIWTNKLVSFFRGDMMSIIVGNGYEGGLFLGNYGRRGTHSDFVGFLVEYGIIGFILFLTMLFKPIVLSFKNKNLATIAPLMLYLVICCVNIEPLTGGYIPDHFFYFYILLLANASNNNTVQGRIYS